MSYQQCTRFRTTVDFDREYLWNRSSNRQADNGVMNDDFFYVWWNNLVNFGSLTKNDLDLWPMTLKFNTVLGVVKVHVRAKFYQADCSRLWVIFFTNFFAYLAIVKNLIIRSCDLNLWPISLILSGFRRLSMDTFLQKFHQAACSGSWVIVLTEKKTPKQYGPSLPRGQ